jgi:probable F420-dependent oxidoreductase
MVKIGLHIRNSGPYATRDMIRDCARIADANGAIDDLWVYDHVAIPPEESEGSEGYYLDPLATLSFLAAVTERVKSGTRVLILPYRPALPTAKWIASIQALSGGRLLLGAGVGWMAAEFNALGIDRSRRGKITDETLAFLNDCFDAKDDLVSANGQSFLFRPSPPKPPIYVGGAAPHALRRAVQYGDGWAVPSGEPDDLRAPIAELKQLFDTAGKPSPEILVQLKIPATDFDAVELGGRVRALADVGVTRVSLGSAYETTDHFSEITDMASHLGE